jgi:uncharacterized membrane protein YoaK (UPF0700 family)
MIRYDRRVWAMAAALSALAGFVDAIGFIELGGFFVSFMSGNSTRLAVGLAGDGAAAQLAAGLIASFVAGVVAGTLVARASAPRRATTVLALVALLLALAAALGSQGAGVAAALLMAAAMGAENAIFERDGEVAIGLTYMTGTLVKLGQRLAQALRGEARWDWLPYLLLWAGLVGGAAGGAAAHAQAGIAALWIAVAGALLMATASLRLAR